MNQPHDIPPPPPPPPPLRSAGMSAFLIALIVLGIFLAVVVLGVLVFVGLVLFTCSRH